MKFSTFLIALGPVLIALIVKTSFEPNWIAEWTYPQLLVLGAMIGLWGAAAARIWEGLNN